MNQPLHKADQLSSSTTSKLFNKFDPCAIIEIITLTYLIKSCPTT